MKTRITIKDLAKRKGDAMKPLKPKCWCIETRKVDPRDGLQFWSLMGEFEHVDRASAEACRDARIKAGEKRKMRIVALDRHGRAIPPERLPPGEK